MHKLPIYFTMAICACLAFTSQAFATADITLNRDPAPPQQVTNDGSGQIAYEFALNFDSNPDRAVVTVYRPNGTKLPTVPYDLEGSTSPVDFSGVIPIPAGSPAGTYNISVDYYTDTDIDGPNANACMASPNNTPKSPNACIEDSAIVNFLVTSQPSVILTKFQDLNRDGSRQAGEPTLSGWTFDLTNAAGAPVAGSPFVTDSTGRIVLSGLTVGTTYTFTEHVQAGWEVVGNASQSFVAQGGQTVAIGFANSLIDMCNNIPGAQSTVPAGYTQVNGDCIVIIDVCDNIPGNQSSVPAGMIQSGASCVPPPVDVCTNIPGNQTTVPAGMNQTGTVCQTPPPLDVCSNLPGAQQTAPADYTRTGTICSPIIHGSAKLASKVGCVTGRFTASVRGTQVATITFYVDGHKVKTVKGSAGSLNVIASKYKIGVHRITAVVTFTASSYTAPRTLKSTFFRCAPPKPAFTG
jgi:hypothetical protein